MVLSSKRKDSIGRSGGQVGKSKEVRSSDGLLRKGREGLDAGLNEVNMLR